MAVQECLECFRVRLAGRWIGFQRSHLVEKRPWHSEQCPEGRERGRQGKTESKWIVLQSPLPYSWQVFMGLLLFEDQLMKSVIAGITVWGASSISQCPEPATTWPWTSDATNLACSMRKVTAGLFAGQHQHRHVKRCRAQLGEVLSVALEVAEILEAGAHAPGLRIGLCIDAAIGLGYRVFWRSR